MPITITLGNRVSQVDCGEDLDALERLRQLFRFHPDGYEYMPTYKNGHWDGYIQMLRRGRVATGLALDVLPTVEKLYPVRIVDKRAPVSFRAPATDVWNKARAYQQECYGKMVEASRTGGLVLQSTGSGKTFVAGLYFSTLQGRGIFFVDELTLLEQARRAIQEVAQEQVGVVGGGKFTPKRITVATVQTLSQRRRATQVAQIQPDVVVIDEIHEAINDRTWKVLELLKPKAVFGLTATLQMKKKAIRYQATAMAGPVIYTYPLEEGVKQGFLSRGVVVRVVRAFGLDAKALAYQSRDERYDEQIVDNRTRNQFVAGLARESAGKGHPTIVLVERIRHLENLEQAMAGFPFVVLSGQDSKEARMDAIQSMRRGELKVILTNRIFGKGVDIPNLEVTIDATGRSSHNQAQQRLGRNSRKTEAKKGFLHFDIADKRLEATKERLVAYRRLKVPIVDVKTPLSAKEVLTLAEERLEESV